MMSSTLNQVALAASFLNLIFSNEKSAVFSAQVSEVYTDKDGAKRNRYHTFVCKTFGYGIDMVTKMQKNDPIILMGRIESYKAEKYKDDKGYSPEMMQIVCEKVQNLRDVMSIHDAFQNKTYTKREGSPNRSERNYPVPAPAPVRPSFVDEVPEDDEVLF